MCIRDRARIEHRAFNRPSFRKRGVKWASFHEYLNKKCSPDYAKDLMRYAKKYHRYLFKRDFSVLNNLSETKRNHVLCALSNLSKYLGIYGEFKKLVADYGLKWKQVNPEMLVLKRMAKTRECGLVLEWAGKVKTKVPSLSLFLDFCFMSGLRVKEAIASWNLIRELYKADRLGEYYNSKIEALEHFRFEETFIRKHKRVLITFMPEAFICKVGSEGERVSWPLLHNRIAKKGLPLRFGDIREYWATFMTRYLTTAEIDFLQGRVGASIFMRNYFNPALITDLKTRVFEGLAELQSRL